MGSISLIHWIVIIGVVAILFGRNTISKTMGDIGQGIKQLKIGMTEIVDNSKDTEHD